MSHFKLICVDMRHPAHGSGQGPGGTGQDELSALVSGGGPAAEICVGALRARPHWAQPGGHWGEKRAATGVFCVLQLAEWHCDQRLPTRAGNEPSRSLKFYNQGEGPYWGLLLVESYYCLHI